MECNNTSFKARRRQAGLTLVETMVSASLAVAFFMGLNSFSIFANRSFAMMGNYAGLENRSTHALDVMSKDIRQTTRLLQYSTSALLFTNDMTSGSIKYNHDPSTRQLIRIRNEGQANQESKVLLSECDQLEFGVFQQNPIPSTFTQVYPTNSLAQTKVIQLHWVCSRTIMQAKINTETVQSAKVIMRYLQRNTNAPVSVF